MHGALRADPLLVVNPTRPGALERRPLHMAAPAPVLQQALRAMSCGGVMLAAEQAEAGRAAAAAAAALAMDKEI